MFKIFTHLTSIWLIFNECQQSHSMDLYDPVNYKDFKETVFKTNRNKTIQNKHFGNNALADNILVDSNDTLRADTLSRFMAAKIFQYTDKLNMMLVPEFRDMIENPIALLHYDPENVKVNPKTMTIGVKSCSLVEIAYMKPKKAVPVCPWHWIITERDDRFPFKRAKAKCNCEDCQSKTIYDSDSERLSSCGPVFTLMSVLHREAVKKGVEKWIFKLEEVPVACVCSIKLNPVF